MKKPQNIQSSKDQAAAFRKAAREAGCEDNEERFRSALRKIAKAKPSGKDNKHGSRSQ